MAHRLVSDLKFEQISHEDSAKTTIGTLVKQRPTAAMEFVDKVLQRFDGQVISILMFGSRARGEAEPDSDMDLLVVMSDADLHRRAIRYIAVEVWLEHGIYLSTRVWSETHWRELAEMQTLLYRNIRQDGINLKG